MRRIQVMTILGLAATLGNMMPGFAGEDNPPSQAGLKGEQIRALEKKSSDPGDGIPWPGSWRIRVWNVMDVVGHQSVACQLKMRKAKVFAQQ